MSKTKIQDDILSYREMCDAEGIQTLQRGMNFRMKPSYSFSPERDALANQMKALYARARPKLPPEWDDVLKKLDT